MGRKELKRLYLDPDIAGRIALYAAREGIDKLDAFRRAVTAFLDEDGRQMQTAERNGGKDLKSVLCDDEPRKHKHSVMLSAREEAVLQDLMGNWKVGPEEALRMALMLVRVVRASGVSVLDYVDWSAYAKEVLRRV